jgi:GNAT superfamily N-acetyltransferase
MLGLGGKLHSRPRLTSRFIICRESRLAILRANLSHLESAWAVIDQCRDALRKRGIEQWDDTYPTPETVAQDIAAEQLFVVSTGPQCHAVVTLNSRQEPEYGTLPWRTAEPALVIHRLCVDPAIQRRGLGRQLMDFAERYATDKKYASIRLDAYSGNADALAFYRQRGYRDVGQVRFPRRPLTFCCFELAVHASRPAT